MEKWIRNCPACKTELIYKSKGSMNSAETAKRKCKSCAQTGITKKPKIPRGSVFQKAFWIKKGFLEDIAIQKVKEIQSKISNKKTFQQRSEQATKTSPFKKESWIKKGMNDIEAEFEVKSRKKLNKEYWIKRGFTDDESIIKVSEFQTTNAKNSKPEDYSPTQLKYWLKKGYDEETAKKLLSKNQATFTLEKCTIKYGEEIGRQKWKERQEKWKALVFNDKQWIGGGKSKISNNLFEKIKNDLSLFGKNERFIRNGDIVFKYDFCIKENKKIIEFNGDFWHCIPSLYNFDFYHPIKKMTALQIWEYDLTKEKLARSKGYDYLVIWESEYKLNPEGTINRCKQFLCN